MFPPKTSALTLYKIADYWSRQPEVQFNKEELLALLEEAWLRGDLPSLSPMQRLGLLRSLYKQGSDRFIFLVGEAKAPVREKSRRHGGVNVDLRPIIRIPSQSPEKWTDESCAGAYEGLADYLAGEAGDGATSLVDLVPSVIKPVLRVVKSGADEVRRWARKQGYPEPDWEQKANQAIGPIIELGKAAPTIARKKTITKEKAEQALKEKYGERIPSQPVAVKYFRDELFITGSRDKIRAAVRNLSARSAGRPRKLPKADSG